MSHTSVVSLMMQAPFLNDMLQSQQREIAVRDTAKQDYLFSH